MSLTVETLLHRNREVAKYHVPLPLLSELEHAPKTVVVTCADPRCIPENFVALSPGEVIVMRTVGGRVETVLKDIVTLDAFIGLDELMIVHHTDCGALHFTDQAIRDSLLHRLPERQDVNGMRFGAFDNLEQSVRDDIGVVYNDSLMRSKLKDGTCGFMLDLKTGSLTRVEP